MTLSPLVSITTLLALFVPALQQAPPPSRDAAPPALVVGGAGEVDATPDRAVVRLGAVAQAPSAAIAQQQVSTAMQGAIAAIREVGVPERAIRTTEISLQPVYSMPNPETPNEAERMPRIVAYRASNAVRVELDGTTNVGAVIDAGVGAGANQLEELSFGLQDDGPQRAEALRLAVADARRKAEILSQAAGVRLLAVRRVEESAVQLFSPDVHFDRMAMETATPVQPGQVRIQAGVTLTYDIGPIEGGEAKGDKAGR